MPNIHYVIERREATTIRMCDIVTSLSEGKSFVECAEAYRCTSSAVLETLEAFIEQVLSVRRWGGDGKVVTALSLPTRVILRYYVDLLREATQRLREEVMQGNTQCWSAPPKNAEMRTPAAPCATQAVHWTKEMEAALGTDTDINIAALLGIRVRQVSARRQQLDITSFSKTKALAKQAQAQKQMEEERNRRHTWANASSPFSFGAVLSN